MENGHFWNMFCVTGPVDRQSLTICVVSFVRIGTASDSTVSGAGSGRAALLAGSGSRTHVHSSAVLYVLQVIDGN